jgi:hypothetical protein
MAAQDNLLGSVEERNKGEKENFHRKIPEG